MPANNASAITDEKLSAVGARRGQTMGWKRIASFLGCLTSKQHAKCTSGTDLLRQVYVLLRQRMQTKRAFSPSHSILTSPSS